MLKLAFLLKDDRGATAVEYGLIVGLLVLAIVGTATEVANETSNMWNHVSNSLDAAVN